MKLDNKEYINLEKNNFFLSSPRIIEPTLNIPRRFTKNFIVDINIIPFTNKNILECTMVLNTSLNMDLILETTLVFEESIYSFKNKLSRNSLSSFFFWSCSYNFHPSKFSSPLYNLLIFSE